MSSNQDEIKSLWKETAITAPILEKLTGEITADVAIIGAGFTGLRAALELAQQGLSVVVLDSHEPGWGASGRNGGQVNPMAHELPDEIINHLGGIFGPRMVQNYANSANELFELVKKHDLKCHATQNGWLRGAHSRPSIHHIEQMAKAWSTAGLDLSLIEGNELQNLIGSKAYSLASKVSSGGSVQPLSYARELCRIAQEKGAQVFSESKVDKLIQKGEQWQVQTDSGKVTSEWVLFCTNAYTDKILKGLKQSVSPIISVQAATRPLTDDEYEEILPQQNTLSDNRRVVFYTRKEENKRLVFGSVGLAQDCNSSDQRRLQRGLQKVFPQLSAKDIEYYWGGKFAITTDGLPHLHEPAKGILAGLGYNGRGVAMATLMGRVLATRVAGTAQKDLDIPTTPYGSFKLRPFHRIGLPAMVKYSEARDAFEEKFSI